MPTRSKDAAIGFFDTNAALYVERYLLPVTGDVLGPRHRATMRMIQDMRLAPASRLLDLGCGPGYLTLELSRLGYRGIGIDAAPRMIQHCVRQAVTVEDAGRWQYLVADVEALPLPTHSFDAVLCTGVIEYLPTDRVLLSEVVRVVKPGGWLLLGVTNKYGYTVSLHRMLHLIKKIPGVLRAASSLRKILVGGNHGAMGLPFLPRKHRPAAVRRMLAARGFHISLDRFVQFTLLPAPFHALTAKLDLRVSEALSALDGTPARILGSCYLVCARLPS